RWHGNHAYSDVPPDRRRVSRPCIGLWRDPHGSHYRAHLPGRAFSQARPVLKPLTIKPQETLMFSQRSIRHCLTASFASAALLLGTQASAADAVVYTSNNVQTIDTAMDIARKQAPDLSIQKVTSGTGALMKRIEAEAANPLGDVVWGAGFGTMAAFKQNFQAYASPEMKDLDERFIGPDNLWAGSNVHVMIIMVNDK